MAKSSTKKSSSKSSSRSTKSTVDKITKAAMSREMLGAGEDVAAAVDDLVETLDRIEHCRIILVSNEVGLGIVPDNSLARMFRDLAGSAHQRLAETCADVYFVVAGLPMTLKGPRLTESSTEMPRTEG
jgi:adenosyl cobinamide kinase/adenosyl cobinamide phosphate guanylyltransferase